MIKIALQATICFYLLSLTSLSAAAIESSGSVYFDEKSLQAGLNYLTQHPAPQVVLLPESFLFERDDSGILHLKKDRETTNSAEKILLAQKKLIEWFVEDINNGLTAPTISMERMIAVNKIVTNTKYSINSLTSEDSFVSINISLDLLSKKIVENIWGTVKSIYKQSGIRPSLTMFSVTAIPKGYFEEDKTAAAPIKVDEIIKLLNIRKNLKKHILKKIRTQNIILSDLDIATILDALDNIIIYRFLLKRSPEAKIETIEIGFNNILFADPEKLGLPKAEYERNGVYFWTTLMPKNPVEFSFPIRIGAFIDGKHRYKAMTYLLNNLKSELTQEMSREQLIKLLADTHQKWALVHLFSDGNGRTYRLIINSILMSYGLPPLACRLNCLPMAQTDTDWHKIFQESIDRAEYPQTSDYPNELLNPSDRDWERLNARIHKLGNILHQQTCSESGCD